jgi:ubiquinone/menaquinone biosynthesis C-methylase UbiE
MAMTQTIDSPVAFDSEKFRQTTRAQWESAAEAWNRWSPLLADWLGPATDAMLDMAAVGPGARVLDVAAGAGEQTVAAARRVGTEGFVLATDISPSILRFALGTARQAGLANVETLELDGERHDTLPEASFDAAISRVGLIYFPDQQRALAGIRRAVKPGGRFAAVVYSTPDRNAFFSLPVGIIRRRAQLPPPLPGQPGPFSLGAEGVLAKALQQAGFRDVDVRKVDSPVRLPS